MYLRLVVFGFVWGWLWFASGLFKGLKKVGGVGPPVVLGSVGLV